MQNPHLNTDNSTMFAAFVNPATSVSPTNETIFNFHAGYLGSKSLMFKYLIN